MIAPMNRVIPVLGAIILLIGVVVSLRTCARGGTGTSPTMSEVPEAPTPDVDTPADTVRSLSAQVAELLEQSRLLSEENQALRTQNAELIGQERRIEDRVRARVEQDLAKARNVGDGLLSALTARIDRLSGQVAEGAAKPPSPPEAGDWEGIPVGFGYGRGARQATIFWVDPLDEDPAEPGTSAGTAFAPGGSLLHPREPVPTQAPASVAAAEVLDGKRPVYTIPANASLMGSSAFTAMLGRIPIGGQVQDPMPFKVLIGADNLAANGHRIPGLESMVMSGYTVGDWTLSCVRGTLSSATFVFDDGHVITFGEQAGGRGPGGENDAEAIGWISDRFGVPCVSGKRITNAPEFLAQRIGITTLEAAAAAAAASETTTTVSPVFGGAATSTVTGDQTTYVLGRAVTSGADEINRWFLERQAHSFDAIFVAAGEPLAVHLDVTLPIDYDPAGRQLDYRTTFSQGGPHAYLD